MRRYALAVLLLLGCTSGALSAVDQAATIVGLVAKAVETVHGFVKAHGSDVTAVDRALTRRDYVGAAIALTQLLGELEREGKPIPPEVQRAQQLVGALAATAIEQGMRAATCGKPEGCAP